MSVADQPEDVLDSAEAGGRAIRGGALFTGTYVVGLLLSIASVPFMIRHLGVVDYGYYVSVSAVVFIIGGFTEAGLTNLGGERVRVWMSADSGPPVVRRVRTVIVGNCGRLTGGNLTLVTSLMGTPYEIETRERIFFTEDVGEEPYRIDRMLTQMLLAGKLQKAAGIVFGECLDCAANDPDRGAVAGPELRSAA